MPPKLPISISFVSNSSQQLLELLYLLSTPAGIQRRQCQRMGLPWDFSYLGVLPSTPSSDLTDEMLEINPDWTQMLEHSPLYRTPHAAKPNSRPQSLVNAQWTYTHYASKHRLSFWARALQPEPQPTQKLPKYPVSNRRTMQNLRGIRPADLLADAYCFLPLKQVLSLPNLTVINQNLMDLMPRDHFDGLIKKALRMFPFLKFNRVAARLTAALFMLLKYKEAYPFLVFLKFLFQDVHYSKHKPYLRFVNYLVLFIIGPRLHSFQCLGAQVVFKGKLAVGGSSRKSVQRTSTGMTSSSSKFIKISRHASAIRTKTGAIGFSVLIAW